MTWIAVPLAAGTVLSTFAGGLFALRLRGSVGVLIALSGGVVGSSATKPTMSKLPGASSRIASTSSRPAPPVPTTSRRRRKAERPKSAAEAWRQSGMHTAAPSVKKTTTCRTRVHGGGKKYAMAQTTRT